MSRILRMLVALAAVLLISSLGVAASAEPVDTSGCMEVFQDFLCHTQDLEWDSAAALMHPDGLDHIKEIVLSAYDVLAESGRPTDEFLSCFEGIENGQQLHAMPASLFFASMMNTVMRIPGIREMIAASETVIIGTVAENDTLVHAVYRTNLEYEGAFITDVEVATVRRLNSTWKIALSMEMEQFAEMFNEF